MVRKFLFNFTLKDKEIKIPRGNNIVSPATGKVIDVLRINEKEDIRVKKGLLGVVLSILKDFGGNGYLISIFMRVYDNHINRTPIDGKVVSVKHFDGKFRYAGSLRSLENEKTEIVLDSEAGRLKLIQIAGYMVRRIETFVKPGDFIKKGSKIGLIRLGSQVTLLVPSGVSIMVKPGQRVKAGETIIGRIS